MNPNAELIFKRYGEAFDPERYNPDFDDPTIEYVARFAEQLAGQMLEEGKDYISVADAQTAFEKMCQIFGYQDPSLPRWVQGPSLPRCIYILMDMGILEGEGVNISFRPLYKNGFCYDYLERRIFT